MASAQAQWTAEITQFRAQSPHEATKEKIRKAVDFLSTKSKGPKHFLFGPHVQDSSELQIMLDQSDIQGDTNTGADMISDPEMTSFNFSLGTVKKVYRVVFKRPAFEPKGAAVANVVEFAQTWFPASIVTPDFQSKIESDFRRFNEICEAEATGNSGWTMGWTVDEEHHPDLREKSRGFLILRGWDSMQDFERLVNSSAFQEAIPILLAWKSPSKMVCVPLHLRLAVDGF